MTVIAAGAAVMALFIVLLLGMLIASHRKIGRLWRLVDYWQGLHSETPETVSNLPLPRSGVSRNRKKKTHAARNPDTVAAHSDIMDNFPDLPKRPDKSRAGANEESSSDSANGGDARRPGNRPLTTRVSCERRVM